MSDVVGVNGSGVTLMWSRRVRTGLGLVEDEGLTVVACSGELGRVSVLAHGMTSLVELASSAGSTVPQTAGLGRVAPIAGAGFTNSRSGLRGDFGALRCLRP